MKTFIGVLITFAVLEILIHLVLVPTIRHANVHSTGIKEKQIGTVELPVACLNFVTFDKNDLGEKEAKTVVYFCVNSKEPVTEKDKKPNESLKCQTAEEWAKTLKMQLYKYSYMALPSINGNISGKLIISGVPSE